jgi:hypothetical protein
VFACTERGGLAQNFDPQKVKLERITEQAAGYCCSKPWMAGILVLRLPGGTRSPLCTGIAKCLLILKEPVQASGHKLELGDVVTHSSLSMLSCHIPKA